MRRKSVMTRLAALAISLLMWLPGMSGHVAVRAQTTPTEQGLTVRPGGLLIQKIRPGEMYDLTDRSGVALTVSNGSSAPVTYALSTHRPSMVGNGKWLPGYLEIPDPGWFWFEQDHLEVEPGGEGTVKMYLHVPEGAQHYNQHWTVSVGVRAQAKHGERLALALYPRYQIETEAAREPGDTPPGTLGIMPSVMRVDAVAPGDTRRGTMRFSNRSAAGTFRASVRVGPPDRSRERIEPSHGYRWIPDPSWLSVQPRTLNLGPQESHELDITVAIPDLPAHYGTFWEALVWISQDDGPPRFARVQIDTVRQLSGE